MVREGRTSEKNALTAEWIARQVSGALPADHGLTPLPRLKANTGGTGGFLKVFFGARCKCETAAVLSVEVSASKSREEVTEALPALVQRLLEQRDAFRKMPCASHRKLRFGQPSS